MRLARGLLDLDVASAELEGLVTLLTAAGHESNGSSHDGDHCDLGHGDSPVLDRITLVLAARAGYGTAAEFGRVVQAGHDLFYHQWLTAQAKLTKRRRSVKEDAPGLSST
jgi:hypothetical protein